MIIETIVTTMDASGVVNIAPMGVEWTGGDDPPVLKPFLETVTYRNVSATGVAVVNLIDDVRVFARAAISNPDYAGPSGGRRARRLASGRLRMAGALGASRSTARRRGRALPRRSCIADFGESSSASIGLVMRSSKQRSTPPAFTSWSGSFSMSELARLQVIVDKTAGPAEQEAMALLADYIRSAPVPDPARSR